MDAGVFGDWGVDGGAGLIDAGEDAAGYGGECTVVEPGRDGAD